MGYLVIDLVYGYFGHNLPLSHKEVLRIMVP